MKIKLLFVPSSIILSVVIFIWMTKPIYDELKSNKEDLTVQNKKLSTIEKQKESMESAKTAYENLGTDKELIDNALPENKNSDDLYAELVGKLSESNIYINKIFFSAPKEIKEARNKSKDVAETVLDSKSSKKGDLEVNNQKRLNEMGVTLEGLGGYPELRNFLISVYSMNRYLNISSLEVSRAKQQGEEGAQEGGGLLQIKFAMNAYFEKPESAEQVSQLVSSNNYVMKNISNGKLSEDVIEEYKSRRTRIPFNFPFSIDGAGKENIFVK